MGYLDGFSSGPGFFSVGSSLKVSGASFARRGGFAGAGFTGAGEENTGTGGSVPLDSAGPVSRTGLGLGSTGV